MLFIGLYLRRIARSAALFAIVCAIFVAALVLSGVRFGVIVYPLILCAAVGAAFLVFDFISARKKYRTLLDVKKNTLLRPEEVPAASTPAEEGFRTLAAVMAEEKAHSEAKAAAQKSEMTEYYTAWVHQIKTPISSMNLTLQGEDTPVSRTLSADLFRIEQYVEMVLTYLRLGSDSTDFVIRPVSLDGIVRQSVRRFSGEFINRKIALHYEAPETEVVTDEKWLAFVVEQILSNALKYTPEGGDITVSMTGGDTLSIRDTGIGIAQEDLPRIFEKGFTGYNGRSHRRASGIGLFLCKRICDSLGHGLSVSSEPGSGTEVRITFDMQRRTFE